MRRQLRRRRTRARPRQAAPRQRPRPAASPRAHRLPRRARAPARGPSPSRARAAARARALSAVFWVSYTLPPPLSGSRRAGRTGGARPRHAPFSACANAPREQATLNTVIQLIRSRTGILFSLLGVAAVRTVPSVIQMEHSLAAQLTHEVQVPLRFCLLEIDQL